MARIKSNFEINKQTKLKLIDEIVTYFRNERDEDIGLLSAELILDFFIEKIAPDFYNLGVQDSIKFISQSIEDMSGLEKY